MRRLLFAALALSLIPPPCDAWAGPSWAAIRLDPGGVELRYSLDAACTGTECDAYFATSTVSSAQSKSTYYFCRLALPRSRIEAATDNQNMRGLGLVLAALSAVALAIWLGRKRGIIAFTMTLAGTAVLLHRLDDIPATGPDVTEQFQQAMLASDILGLAECMITSSAACPSKASGGRSVVATSSRSMQITGASKEEVVASIRLFAGCRRSAPNVSLRR